VPVAGAELEVVAAGGLVVVAREREREQDAAGDDGATGRQSGQLVVVEPGVDAVDVEGVGGAGQLLEALVVRELGEADGALERGRRRDTRARRYLMTGSAATRSGSSLAGSSAS